MLEREMLLLVLLQMPHLMPSLMQKPKLLLMLNLMPILMLNLMPFLMLMLILMLTRMLSLTIMVPHLQDHHR